MRSHCTEKNLAIVILGCIICCAGALAVPTTDLLVSEYGADGTPSMNKSVTIQWMEANLPVQGDGTTHYYHQGPVFVESKEGQWDRNETTNFKDMGAVKGTAVRDLCDLVGGMNAGDDVMVKAVDGYHVEIPYENIYYPDPRQGNITVCW
ncbi:MAG TPA: argininosuccinate synthase, partial [Methanoregulaceae archaeon]|nr:argininosuccinate synthase [Methanoregulaceae archaeon]